MTDDDSRIQAEEAGTHEDDGHGGGHGHGADPNAGVVRGEPPTPAWLGAAALIGLVTLVAAVILAFALADAETATTPTGGTSTTEQGEH